MFTTRSRTNEHLQNENYYNYFPLWFLILCVSLIRLRDASVVGKTFLVDVPLRVIPEEISIWISRLSKEKSSQQSMWTSPKPLKAWMESKNRGEGICSAWSRTSTSSRCWQSKILASGPLDSDWDLQHQLPWFSDFWTWGVLHH